MLRLGYLLVFLVINALLAALNLRAYRWINEAFAPPRGVRRVIAAGLVAAWLVTALGRFLARTLPDLPIAGPLLVSLIVELSVLVAVALLLTVDFWRAGHRIAVRLSGLFPRRTSAARRRDEPVEPREEARLDRRSFTTRALVGSAFLASGSSSLYGVLAGRHDYIVEEVPIPISGLSTKLDGFAIVQLSDLHIGTFVREPELAAAVDLVRTAKPDLIVLTGDLIDNDPRLAPMLGRFVRRLEGVAREGVTVISGNHDYYAGITETLNAVREGGANLLRNRGRVIGDARAGFALLGVDDMRGRRFERGGGPDLHRALESLPRLGGRVAPARDLPRVLLCHNPSYFEVARGQVALQLSGHTHGGQYNPGVHPASWVFRHGWVAGRYESSGSELYVNRGFGTAGPPVRLGAPPEVTRLILTART